MNAISKQQGITPDWVEIVLAHVQSMKFGTVQITVHESRVVQVEKTEKVRLDRAERERSR